jgi:amino acid adenylation domain-containing protein
MTPDTIDAIYPTTAAQQGYLLGSLAHPADALFVEQALLPLQGPLDPDRLRRSWGELTRRRQILRTALAWDLGGGPRQVVLPMVDVEIPLLDVQDGSADDRERTLQQLLADHRATPFELARPPLVRLAVQRRGHEDHVLVWSHHHAILDGWSQMRLVEGLIGGYNRPSDRPSPSRPFGEYAEWLGRQARERHRAFWRGRLVAYSAPAPLPERPLPPHKDRFGAHEAALSVDEHRRLAEFARAGNLTVATTTVACWGLIAAHQRSTDDLAVGITMSGRSPEFTGVHAVLGPLATTVPERLTVDPGRRFVAWAAEIQDSLAQASPLSDCTAAEIQTWAELAPDRPLFDSIVAIGNYPRPQPSGGTGSAELSLSSSGIRGFGGRTLHPLILVVTTFDGLRLRLVNDRRAVADDTAEEALECLRGMLTSLRVTSTVRELLEQSNQLRRFADEDHRPALPVGSAAISGTMEDVVTRAFAAVLGQERVPVDADFIALGGHSILALRLLARLRESFAVDLTLGDLLQARSPRALARRIGELLGTGTATSQPLPGITPAPEALDQAFPLTAVQQAYWAGRKPDFELGGVDSHLYGEVDVAGLDLNRLEAAWRRLVVRHPMLRAVVTDDGLQRVLAEVPPYRIPRADLRDTPDGGAGFLAATRARLSHVRRCVSAWPLFTIEAALLPGGVTRLFLSFDLLIGDALSWRILYRELRALYDDPNHALPELRLRFSDYVAALASLRQHPAYRQARDYWRSRLPELPPPPAFPLARQPRELTEVRFVRRQLSLAWHEATALRQLATAHGVTLSTMLLAAFAETLARHTSSRSFLINVTIYNRLPLHPQVDDVVGDFTSLLPAVVQTEGGTFADRLRRLQRQLWTDLDHRLYEGIEVLRELGERGASRTAAPAPVVFTSTVDLGEPTGEQPPPLPGTVVYALGQTPQVSFDYQTYLAGGDLVINWDTVEELFPSGYLDEMLAAHGALLRALISDPEAVRRPEPMGSPPAPDPLPEPLGGEQLLHEPFLRQCRRTPDAVAVVSDDRRLTYAQLHDLAASTARRLTELAPTGDLVAVVARKGWEQVAGALAALMAGYAFVPIEASWPPTRIAALLAKTRATVALTQRRLLEELSLPETVTAVPIDRADGIAAAPARQGRSRTADDLAYVIFTSGSTGAPKGVMISHRAALNTVLDVNRRFQVGPEDRALAVSPLSFDLAIYDIFGMLAAGGAVVIPPADQGRNPACWAELVAGEGVTVWNSVPVLMDLLLNSLDGDAANALTSLRLCLLSGDWIPLQLPAALRRRAPHVVVVGLGGATEASIWSIMYQIGQVDPAWVSIPYGYALTGQSVEVLRDDLTPCPLWIPGEIFIAGHGLALGYWAEPELTDRSFLYDPRTGRRLYRTGDWGRRRPDGTIEFLGRHDEQVKVGGYRVEPREVEAAVGAVDGVARAAVVVTGERGERRLVAFTTGDATASQVRAQLSPRLPPHLLPSLIHPVDDLPLTATGKVDRAALTQMAAGLDPRARPEGPPATERAGEDVEALGEVVAAFLPELPPLDSDLLAYGLTSIDVIRLCNAVEHRFGIRPDIEAFYREPTLRTLTRALAGPARAAARPPDRGAAPPSVWTAWPPLTDPDDRLAFRSARPAFPPQPARRLLPPGPPRHLERRVRRRSPLRFGEQPLPLARLSRMLDCLRRVEMDGRPSFLYPSAGGLYSVATYLHVRPDRITGLGSGLYYYHPDAHDLAPVVDDIDLDATVHEGVANRPIVESAAFTILLVTDPADSGPLYQEDAHPLNLLNAGYIGQLLCDHAIDAGLGLCPIHGVHFDRIRWLFPAGDRAVLLHTLVGGIPASVPPGAGDSAPEATSDEPAPGR